MMFECLTIAWRLICSIGYRVHSFCTYSVTLDLRLPFCYFLIEMLCRHEYDKSTNKKITIRLRLLSTWLKWDLCSNKKANENVTFPGYNLLKEIVSINAISYNATHIKKAEEGGIHQGIFKSTTCMQMPSWVKQH